MVDSEGRAARQQVWQGAPPMVSHTRQQYRGGVGVVSPAGVWQGCYTLFTLLWPSDVNTILIQSLFSYICKAMWKCCLTLGVRCTRLHGEGMSSVTQHFHTDLHIFENKAWIKVAMTLLKSSWKKLFCEWWQYKKFARKVLSNEARTNSTIVFFFFLFFTFTSYSMIITNQSTYAV